MTTEVTYWVYRIFLGGSLSLLVKATLHSCYSHCSHLISDVTDFKHSSDLATHKCL